MRLLAIAAFSSRVYSISKHGVVGSSIHVEYIISIRLAYKVYNDSLPDGIVTSAQLTPVWYKSEKPKGGGALGAGGGGDSGGDGGGAIQCSLSVKNTWSFSEIVWLPLNINVYVTF